MNDSTIAQLAITTDLLHVVAQIHSSFNFTIQERILDSTPKAGHDIIRIFLRK